ncbi:MAG TPA: LysR family transcriptional regulator [Aliidongia sp.]|nr:LysR family transcriptional regulator [Aliidongia sp.]
MDWDHLRVFLAVARSGQLLAAGRKLGLNHATVARRLDALEQALGAPLFERRPAGSALTQAGERLLPVAERVEAEVLVAVEGLRADDAEVSGTVRIGAPDGLGNTFLARELGILAARHPGLTIELVPLPRIFSLSRRDADIAIVLDRPTHGRLIVSKLVDYSLGVYASARYLEQAGTPHSRQELDRHVVVTGVEDFAYAAALDYATALEPTARQLFRCASVMGQLEAIRSGIGLGVLHDFTTIDRSELIRILPGMSFTRSYWMLSHPDTHDVKRVATCRAFLTKRFAEERERFLPFPPPTDGL